MSSSPIHDEGTEDLYPVNTVHSFPINYFVENIAVRRSGQLLVTVHNRGELFQIDPSSKSAPCLVHHFSTGISGIVEVEEDIFYVSVGEISAKGSFAIYQVNMLPFAVDESQDVKTPATVSKLVEVPDALFLNGSALLSASKGIILVADSILGTVFSVNVGSREVKVWLQDKALGKVTDNPYYPGVNGIKIHKGALYLSNTDAKTFLRAGISATGEATGSVDLVYDRCNADDFAFDSEGSVYLTTHVLQSLLKIRNDGVRTRIAGGPADRAVAGTTAAAFGRTSLDRTILYVTTNGGMSNPVDGEVGPARVLSIDVGRTGDIAILSTCVDSVSAPSHHTPSSNAVASKGTTSGGARFCQRGSSMETFENIYLDLSKQPGKCRFAESGLGWKPSAGGETFTLDGSNIAGAQWSRASKGYELKIYLRSSGVIQLDGFEQEDFERASKAFKIWYGITLENKEHALRGWNWGKAEFGKSELAFNVQNRPAFEIPYSEISNTNLAGKNEVAVEFNLGAESAANGVNGHKGGTTKNRGRKAAAGRDELVEMRFYIPGTVVKKEKDGDDNDSGEDEDAEEQNAANLFYDTLIDKAEIGEVAGDTFATFLDVLHLTPRGRFDIDMYESSFRLRGKTYDYKIQYQSIKKFFILPKNDETHTLITLGLDPPLRQGQTRYPFIVMQLKLDEEVSIDLNMTEEMLETKYKDKLEPHYEAPIHHVIAKVFKGLSGKKIIMPSKDFISHHNMNGVKCSIKANEGLLFCLDKSFMFVPKPATYVQIEQIQGITMSRVGGALAASRTFDITMTLKGGQGEYQFSNINREEQQPLEDFFKAKNIRCKNEMLDDSATLLAARLDPEELASSDEEAVGGARGSADEDEESVDEDFQADSESDVAEEYDSAHESEGSGSGASDGGSDAEMPDADVDGASEEEERPKKKPKV